MNSIQTLRGMLRAVLVSGLLAQSAAAYQWSQANGVTPETKLLYHFDEAGTTVTDSGPGGYHNALSNAAMRATLTAPAWLATPTGSYIEQSVSNTYRMTNAPSITGINFNGGVTLSGWFRPRAGETNSGVLFYLETATQLPRMYVNTSDNFGAPTYEARMNFMVANVVTSSLVTLDASWHHVAVVYDPLDADASNGGQWRLYLDNSLVGSGSDSRNLSTATSFGLGIGRDPWTSRSSGWDYDEIIVENGVVTDFAANRISVPLLSEWGMLLLFAVVAAVGWRKLRPAPAAAAP